MTTRDDKSLVRDTLEGDPRSFEVLVERYYKVLYNVALRMLHEPEDARDATQSAFLKAFAKLSTFDGMHEFFSWIYRIQMNEVLNQRGRRRPQEPLDPEMAARQKGPDDDTEEHETSDAIGAALMRISLEHREVIILRHFLTLSYAEIGSILDLPQKTVKSRLFEARRQLGGVLMQGGVAGLSGIGSARPGAGKWPTP